MMNDHGLLPARRMHSSGLALICALFPREKIIPLPTVSYRLRSSIESAACFLRFLRPASRSKFPGRNEFDGPAQHCMCTTNLMDTLGNQRSLMSGSKRVRHSFSAYSNCRCAAAQRTAPATRWGGHPAAATDAIGRVLQLAFRTFQPMISLRSKLVRASVISGISSDSNVRSNSSPILNQEQS
jgi:hypothetical protein